MIDKKSPNHLRCVMCSKMSRSRKKDFGILICQACKFEFKPNQATQKFCNLKCKKDFDRKECNNKWIMKEKKKVRKPLKWGIL